MIRLKTKQDIEAIRLANEIVHDVLNLVGLYIRPGVTTKELDDIAEKRVVLLGAVPTFKGYRGFPASICISVNDEIVHGIPGNRIIKDGDIVSIDFGATYKGFVGDAARTTIVGNALQEVFDLNQRTKLGLMAGIEKMVAGNRLSDIGAAIDGVAKKYRYGNIKDFSGHGVGFALHELPKVLNYVDQKAVNVRLQAGMVLAIEPMFTLGTSDTKILNDGWTVVTTDESLAAHWEVSVAITDNGPDILGTEP